MCIPIEATCAWHSITLDTPGFECLPCVVCVCWIGTSHEHVKPSIHHALRLGARRPELRAQASLALGAPISLKRRSHARIAKAGVEVH